MKDMKINPDCIVDKGGECELSDFCHAGENRGTWRRALSRSPQNPGRNRNTTREEFVVDGTPLAIEDRIDNNYPWLSERILWIAGTCAYYSTAPICPARHKLLCFTYCEDVLKAQKPGFLKNALVLGCGGGAVPRWILEEYPDASVDIVDRSPQIIFLCKKYFLQRWNDSARLTYHCTDARDYEPPEYRYQFIFCDMFDGENLAPVVSEHDFAVKLRDMMSDDGIMMVNCGWNDNLQKVREVYRTVFRHLKVLQRDSWQTQVIQMSK